MADGGGPGEARARAAPQAQAEAGKAVEPSREASPSEAPTGGLLQPWRLKLGNRAAEAYAASFFAPPPPQISPQPSEEVAEAEALQPEDPELLLEDLESLLQAAEADLAAEEAPPEAAPEAAPPPAPAGAAGFATPEAWRSAVAVDLGRMAAPPARPRPAPARPPTAKAAPPPPSFEAAPPPSPGFQLSPLDSRAGIFSEVSAPLEKLEKLRMPDSILPEPRPSPRGARPEPKAPEGAFSGVAFPQRALREAGPPAAPPEPASPEAAAPVPEAKPEAPPLQAPPQTAAADPPGLVLREAPEIADPTPPELLTLLPVAEILDAIRADPAARAQEALAEARREAWPQGELQKQYPQLGEERSAQVQADLMARYDQIAAAAQGAAVDLEAAARRRRTEIQASGHEARADLRSETEAAAAEISAAAAGERREAAEAGALAAAQARGEALALTPDEAGLLADLQTRSLEMVKHLTTRAARLRVDQEIRLQTRLTALELAQAAHLAACDAVRLREEAALAQEAESLGADRLRDQRGALEVWAQAERRRLSAGILDLKAQATQHATEIGESAGQAHEAGVARIRDWTAEQSEERRQESSERVLELRSWLTLAEAEIEIKAALKAREILAASAQDYLALEAFRQTKGEGIDLETDADHAALSQARQAVIAEYYGAPSAVYGPPPPREHRSLAALAAGMSLRIQGEAGAALSGEMRAEILARARAMGESAQPLDLSELQRLDELARAETPGFSSEALADSCDKAIRLGVTGLGTGRDDLFKALSDLTAFQGHVLRARYVTMKQGERLDDALFGFWGDLSGAEADRARAALAGDSAGAAAAALKTEAFGLGADPEKTLALLRGRSPERLQEIRAKYRELYGEDLLEALPEAARAEAAALIDGDLPGAQAARMERAIQTRRIDPKTALPALAAGLASGPAAIPVLAATGVALLAPTQALPDWATKTEADARAVDKLYEDIRKEVETEAASRPMSEAEIKTEILRRNQALEFAYRSRTGRALRQDFAALSPAERLLAEGGAEADRTAVDAARLKMEFDATFVSEDKAILSILEAASERELEKLKRDPDRLRAREDRLKAMRKAGAGPYEIDVARREMDRDLEREARREAQPAMKALARRYRQAFGVDLVLRLHQRLSGDDKSRGVELFEKGALSAENRLLLADGDSEEIKTALKGRTRAELLEIEANVKRAGGASFAQILGKLKGREAHDVRRLMQGIPETPEEAVRRGEEDLAWETSEASLDPGPGAAGWAIAAGWGPMGLLTVWSLKNGVNAVGDALSREERARLESRVEAMRRTRDLLRSPGLPEEERARLTGVLRTQDLGAASAAQARRERFDAASDAAVDAAIIAASVGVEVASGGAATPAVAPALARTVLARSLLATARSAAIGALAKTALKGDRLRAADLAQDAAMLPVEMLTNLLTAGLGGKVFGSLAGSTLKGRMAKAALEEALEGGLGAVPTALAGRMLQPGFRWSDLSPSERLDLLGAAMLQGAASGVARRGATGAARRAFPSAAAKPVPRPSRAEVSGDVLAHQGSPAERLAAWRAYKAEHPEAGLADFIRAHQAEAVSRQTARAEQARMERAARGVLLEQASPEVRRVFGRLKTDVVSDSEFLWRTGSKEGNAVVLIQADGSAGVVLRQSLFARPADMKFALREEGHHLGQLLDPRTRDKALRLNEDRLARAWPVMSVRKKTELHWTQLELESDALRGVERDVKAELRGLPRGAERDALLQELIRARAGLARLGTRKLELEALKAFSFYERFKMDWGFRPLPEALAQTPRLFNTTASKDDAQLDASARAHLKRVAEEAPAGTIEDLQVSDLKTRPLTPGPPFLRGAKGREDSYQLRNGELQMRPHGGKRYGDVPKGAIIPASADGPAFRYKGGAEIELRTLMRRIAGENGPREQILQIDSRNVTYRGWGAPGRQGVETGKSGEALLRWISRIRAAVEKDPVLFSFVVPRGPHGLDLVEVRKAGVYFIEMKYYNKAQRRNAAGKGEGRRRKQGGWVSEHNLNPVTDDLTKNIEDLKAYLRAQKTAQAPALTPRQIRMLQRRLKDDKIGVVIMLGPDTRFSAGARQRLEQRYQEHPLMQKSVLKTPLRVEFYRNLVSKTDAEAETMLSTGNQGLFKMARPITSLATTRKLTAVQEGARLKEVDALAAAWIDHMTGTPNRYFVEVDLRRCAPESQRAALEAFARQAGRLSAEERGRLKIHVDEKRLKAALDSGPQGVFRSF